MAEQSIGMATGAGDGVVGGYPTSRMTAMETKTLSDGLLQTGGKLALSGTGTSTLTIADGAAVVGGYFYENTSSASISVSSLTSGVTYIVAVLVNASAGSVTVAQSVSGTTITQYAVRVVVATAGQIGSRPYLQLGTVTISGTTIGAITPSYAAYGTTTQLPLQVYSTMSGGSATLTAASTTYDVTGYGSPTTTADAVLLADNSAGTITVRRAGLYTVTITGSFGTGTTGWRLLGVQVGGTFVNSTRAASSGNTAQNFTHTVQIVCAAGDVIKAGCQSSIVTQALTSGTLTVAWA